MLRSFRVANHKSIKDEVELSLLPAYDKDRPVLPVAGIFGANASGKSNLLGALAFAQYAVRRSYADWEPGSGVPRMPFLLDPAALTAASHYVVDLELDGVRHTYGFAVDGEQVVEEWLYAYPHRKKRVTFERTGQRIDVGSTVRARDLPKVRPNALALSAMSRANVAEVAAVYEWFRSGIAISSGSEDSAVAHLHSRLLTGGADAEQVVGLVRAADVGISDIEAIRDEAGDPPTGEADAWVSAVNTQLLAALQRRRSAVPVPSLRFLHGPERVPMALPDQSDGTRTWLRLVVDALGALDAGAVLLVDEIDSSLHPRLTARLIELFRDERTNRRHAQLIFTTHDATLLGTSFGAEILGRDEVWFIEKGTDGGTKLFSLSEFRPRKGENTERRYLGGSYGAVPAVFSDTLVEQLLTASREPTGAEA